MLIHITWQAHHSRSKRQNVHRTLILQTNTNVMKLVMKYTMKSTFFFCSFLTVSFTRWQHTFLDQTFINFLDGWRNKLMPGRTERHVLGRANLLFFSTAWMED